MLRSKDRAAGTSADVQVPEGGALPSAAPSASHQHDPAERQKPPPLPPRATSQRAQPEHAPERHSHDLLGLSVTPPERWQSGTGEQVGRPRADNWLPPLPSRRAPTAAAQGAQGAQGSQPLEAFEAEARSGAQRSLVSRQPRAADLDAFEPESQLRHNPVKLPESARQQDATASGQPQAASLSEWDDFEAELAAAAPDRVQTLDAESAPLPQGVRPSVRKAPRADATPLQNYGARGTPLERGFQPEISRGIQPAEVSAAAQGRLPQGVQPTLRSRLPQAASPARTPERGSGAELLPRAMQPRAFNAEAHEPPPPIPRHGVDLTQTLHGLNAPLPHAGSSVPTTAPRAQRPVERAVTPAVHAPPMSSALPHDRVSGSPAPVAAAAEPLARRGRATLTPELPSQGSQTTHPALSAPATSHAATSQYGSLDTEPLARRGRATQTQARAPESGQARSTVSTPLQPTAAPSRADVSQARADVSQARADVSQARAATPESRLLETELLARRGRSSGPAQAPATSTPSRPPLPTRTVQAQLTTLPSQASLQARLEHARSMLAQTHKPPQTRVQDQSMAPPSLPAASVEQVRTPLMMQTQISPQTRALRDEYHPSQPPLGAARAEQPHSTRTQTQQSPQTRTTQGEPPLHNTQLFVQPAPALRTPSSPLLGEKATPPQAGSPPHNTPLFVQPAPALRTPSSPALDEKAMPQGEPPLHNTQLFVQPAPALRTLSSLSLDATTPLPQAEPGLQNTQLFGQPAPSVQAPSSLLLGDKPTPPTAPAESLAPQRASSSLTQSQPGGFEAPSSRPAQSASAPMTRLQAAQIALRSSKSDAQSQPAGSEQAPGVQSRPPQSFSSSTPQFQPAGSEQAPGVQSRPPHVGSSASGRSRTAQGLGSTADLGALQLEAADEARMREGFRPASDRALEAVLQAGALRLREDESSLSLRLRSQFQPPEHTPAGGTLRDSMQATEPLPATTVRRATWPRWTKATFAGIALGAVTSVALGYSAAWLQLLPREELTPVLLKAAPSDTAQQPHATGALASQDAPSIPKSRPFNGSRFEAATAPALAAERPAAHSGARVAAPVLPSDTATTESSVNAASAAESLASAGQVQAGRRQSASQSLARALAPAAPPEPEHSAASRAAVPAQEQPPAPELSPPQPDSFPFPIAARANPSAQEQAVRSAAPATAEQERAALAGTPSGQAPQAEPSAPPSAALSNASASVSSTQATWPSPVPPSPAVPSTQAAVSAPTETAPGAYPSSQPPAPDSTTRALDAASRAPASAAPGSSALTALDQALAPENSAQQAPASPEPTSTPVPEGERPVLTIKPLESASVSDPSNGMSSQPSREQVRDVMLAMHSNLARCAGDKHGTTYANVTVQATGRVSYSLIEGAFAGTETGSCMARTLRAATFPPFAGPPFKVRYPLVF